MAILKDFLAQVSFEEVWAILSRGEGLEDYREAYEQMLSELQETAPRENTAQMTIRFVEEAPEWQFFFGDEEDGEDAEPTLQVCGFIPGDQEGYAIGVKPADVLVGLDVDPETAARYTPAEIVAHCLAEMTYSTTMAESAYGIDRDTAGGGLLASQVCMDKDINNVDLTALREQLGALPKPDEDLKKKYGFLF